MLNKQNVEDVVQNVFLTLQSKSAELEPDHLRAWLYSVAQKKLLEQKREEIRTSRLINYEADLTVNDPALLYEISEEGISDAEIDRVKRKIMNALTPEERQLFEAIYEKRIKRRELSQQMGITENALNVRAYRLRNHIRKLAETAFLWIVFVIVKCR